MNQTLLEVHIVLGKVIGRSGKGTLAGNCAKRHMTCEQRELTRAEAALETPTRREDFIIIFELDCFVGSG